MADVGVCGRVSGLRHGWGHVAGVGTCGRVWGHVAGLGACGRGGCRVWGYVAGVGYVVGGQAYDMDGGMWWGLGHVAGGGACGRVWRTVAGCGGLWQR